MFGSKSAKSLDLVNVSVLKRIVLVKVCVNTLFVAERNSSDRTKVEEIKMIFKMIESQKHVKKGKL